MTNKLLKLGIVIVFAFGYFQGAVAQVTATVDGSANWIGYANVFFTDGNYAFGSAWGLEDIKSEVSVENNTVTLFPNFNTYNADDPYWSDGDLGNKIFEGNTYAEIYDDIVGQDFTFTGTVQSHTLDSEYVTLAFVKGLNPDNNWSTDVFLSAPLVAGETFSLTAENVASGLVIQYGFSVIGLNANPVDETSLGNVVVGQATASVNNFDNNRFSYYPNPVKDILHIYFDTEITNISVMNMLGQVVINQNAGLKNTQVDMTSLPAGNYLVKATSEGVVKTIKVVKQ